MKTCSKCKKEKPLSEYYKDKRTQDGYYSGCKKCHLSVKNNSSTAKYGRIFRQNLRQNPNSKDVAKYLYDAMYRRLLYSPYYANRKCGYSLNEFEEWIKNNWSSYLSLHQAWLKSGFKRSLAPSIDRIDNKLDYQLDNIQFLTLSENLRKDKLGVKRSKDTREKISKTMKNKFKKLK